MPEFIENIWNSPSRYVIILIAAIVVIYIPAMMIYMKKKKNQSKSFLSSNPTASKVLIMGVMKGTLTVMSVNGDVPVTFYESGKRGFYLLPGKNELEVQYTWTRPGVMYKTVTTTVGPNTLQVTTGQSKTYHISYDKKAEKYDFTEV